MSDLTTFRDHARRMAAAAHRGDCRRTGDERPCGNDALTCPDREPHDAHTWVKHELDWRCPGRCGGCMPESERALWSRLADETDAYLHRAPEETLL